MNLLQKNSFSCPLFSVCSGCKHKEEVRTPPVWEEICGFFQKIAPFLSLELISGEIIEYRSKVKLAVRGTENNPKIGLFKEGTHEVVDLEECPLHYPLMNEALKDLRVKMKSFFIKPYEEKTHLGRLRYLQMFIDRKTLKIQLVLVWNGKSLEKEETLFVNQLYNSGFYHSIWANFSEKKTNSILGDEWKLLEGNEEFIQEIGNIPFHFHPSCFSQAHLSLFEQMISYVESLVSENKTLLELYSGVGCFGLSLAHKAKQVTLIESSPHAKSSFEKTLKTQPLDIQKKCYFLSGFAEEMSWNQAEVILVDPPRKGLSKAGKERIHQSEASELIYVSCGFDSLMRDTEEILARGWKIDQIKGFLLFPGTNHVELIVRFFRKPHLFF